MKTIAKQDLFINDEIRVREVRLIGLDGEQLGIKPLSEADVAEGELAGLAVKVERAEGEKCPRCWHYATDIGANPEHPSVCGRCVENVAGNGEVRHFA